MPDCVGEDECAYGCEGRLNPLGEWLIRQTMEELSAQGWPPRIEPRK